MGFLIGALLASFIIIRFFLFIIKKIKSPKDDVSKILLAGVCSLLAITMIGGFGFADGGNYKFGYTFLSYLLSIVLIVSFQILLTNRRKNKNKKTKAE